MEVTLRPRSVRTAVNPASPTSSQAEYEERQDFEMLLADVCAQFINIAPTEVDSQIENAQSVVCESLRVDQSALWQASEDNPDQFKVTHTYRHPKLRALGIFPSTQDYFPWSFRKIRN